jgi:hypothetical protein
MGWRSLLVVALVLCSWLQSRDAIAGLIQPYSWTQVSSDGRHVLVMISPLSLDGDARHPQRAEEVRAIRSRYLESGLYRNDGSNTPIHTLPYSSPACEAFVAGNGKHVVLYSTDWRDSRGHAITFYAAGNQLTSYSQQDLWKTMPMMKWKHFVRSSRSPDAHFSFQDEALACTMRTEADEVFVFDAQTGAIISQSTPWPLYFTLGVGMPPFALTVLALTIVWRRNLRRRT